MQTEITAQDQVTAACLSPLAVRHAKCSGRLISLVRELDGKPCLCSHHEPEPIEDRELDEILSEERETERAIEARLELDHFGDYGHDDDANPRWSS